MNKFCRALTGEIFCGNVALGVLVALSVTLMAGVAVGQEKHPMTVEDMIRLKVPSGIVVSPDGKMLAYVVASRDLESNESLSSVWLRQIESGEEVQITAGGTGESSPTWAPDSLSLLFVSDKSEKGQIWRWDVAKKEASQVTDVATGASAPRYTNDGKYILFTARVFPDCDSFECNKERLEGVAADPVKASLFTKLMYRHWDHWRDGRVAHIFVMQAAGGEMVDQMQGNRWGVTGGWSVSPDGQWILYTTKNPKNEALNTNNDIYELPVSLPGAPDESSDRRPRRLTMNEGYDANPQYSPDGKTVLYHSQERNGYESDLYRLTTLPAYGGAPQFLASEIDQWILDFGWLPDGKLVWFADREHGRNKLHVVASSGEEKARLILGDAFLSDIAVAPDGSRFYFVRQKLDSPPEIWTVGADGKEPKALTSMNGWLLKEVALAKVEEVWWTGAAGTKIHGFVLFPPGTSKDKANPFLMLIHGGPQGMWADNFHPRWNAQLFAAPGYVTFLPNPRGSHGYGQPFVEQISRDWGGKVYVDLMNGVDFLIEKGWVDPKRMCAGGGSFGGYMANWILGKNNRFACLFSHAGVYDLVSMYGSTEELWFPEWEYGGTPWESEDYTLWSPSQFVKNFKTPMLVIHGANDFRVPLNQAMQLFTALQRMGVPSKFLYFPDETHFVVKPKNTKLWYDTVHSWVGQWLNK